MRTTGLSIPFSLPAFLLKLSRTARLRTVGLRLLDRVNLAANRWLVANQFVVQGEREVIRAGCGGVRQRPRRWLCWS